MLHVIHVPTFSIIWKINKTILRVEIDLSIFKKVIINCLNIIWIKTWTKTETKLGNRCRFLGRSTKGLRFCKKHMYRVKKLLVDFNFSNLSWLNLDNEMETRKYWLLIGWSFFFSRGHVIKVTIKFPCTRKITNWRYEW